jgi:hypothetical protein
MQELKDAEQVAQARGLLAGIKAQLAQLDEAMESTRQKAFELAKFFGEEASSADAGQVVVELLSDFVSNFGHSKAKLLAKLQKVPAGMASSS